MVTRKADLINEKKKESTIIQSVGAKSQDGKMNRDYKTSMVVIFKLQNSHLLTLSLPAEEICRVNDQNRPVANFPAADFPSQPREIENDI